MAEVIGHDGDVVEGSIPEQRVVEGVKFPVVLVPRDGSTSTDQLCVWVQRYVVWLMICVDWLRTEITSMFL